MKNENIIRAIGALDDELIHSAERRSRSGPVGRRKIRRPVTLAAAIAAVMLLLISICLATGVLDGFYNHFSGGGELEKYSEYIAACTATAASEDVEIGVSGAVMDRRRLVLVLSVKGLSEEGRELVNTKDFPLAELEITAGFKDGAAGEISHTASWHKGSRNMSAAWSSYAVSVSAEAGELSDIESLSISYGGASMQLALQDYALESRRLESGDPAALRTVEMSPLGIYLELPITDRDPSALRQLVASTEVIPILADGSLAGEYFLNGGGDGNVNSDFYPLYMSFVIIEDRTLKTELTDLSQYSGLQINGIDYFFAD